VQALVQATHQLGTGDLSARTGLPYRPGELYALAHGFDAMATSLEQLTQRHALILEAVGEGICGLN
jgi:HAMP domain-containing protein